VGEPEAKGSGFTAPVDALRGMVPADAWARFVAALPADTQQLIAHPPLAVAWVPFRHFMDVLRAAEPLLFDNDAERFSEVGRIAVGAGLKTLYRAFIRLASPQFVIERSARMYETYVRNNGSVRAVSVGPKMTEVYYSGLHRECVSPASWAYQRGALQAVSEAINVKTARVERVKGGGRAADCIFRITW
jgi:hypothetical protein